LLRSYFIKKLSIAGLFVLGYIILGFALNFTPQPNDGLIIFSSIITYFTFLLFGITGILLAMLRWSDIRYFPFIIFGTLNFALGVFILYISTEEIVKTGHINSDSWLTFTIGGIPFIIGIVMLWLSKTKTKGWRSKPSVPPNPDRMHKSFSAFFLLLCILMAVLRYYYVHNPNYTNLSDVAMLVLLIALAPIIIWQLVLVIYSLAGKATRWLLVLQAAVCVLCFICTLLSYIYEPQLTAWLRDIMD